VTAGDGVREAVGVAATSEGDTQRVPPGRLVGWFVLVGLLATLSYAANLSEAGDPPNDLLYRWSTAVAGVVQYAIILVVVLLLARGLPRETALGLRRPASWPRALGLVLAGYVVILAIAYVLDLVLQAGEEQGLVPEEWEPSRAAPFVANFLVVAIVAPVVEELTYRGLGYGAIRAAWGSAAAVVVTSLAFGLAHGLVVALPVLTLFGVVLALVRARTESVYPPIVLHAAFNGIALLAAVTLVEGFA
jgi:membrane protease YdiL (CAAX protease family)